MKNPRHYLIFCSIAALPFLANLPLMSNLSEKKFHSTEEISMFKMMSGDTSLPTGFNTLFAASGACAKCHGKDSLGIASVDPNGQDINVVDDWRATMMANSAKDPFWRAKVSHEIIINPNHKEKLEQKCITCHAPLGHFNGQYVGTEYQFNWLEFDPVGRDGVSCVVCHQQSSKQLGDLHSGHLNFDTVKVAYGPYEEPLVSPMFTATGYEPVYSEHISDAGICAGCHTLITETVDLDGNLTGNTFVEQATYHEWLNSTYQTDNTTCQNCHMPALEKGFVTLVTGSMVEPRFPFYLHELVGGNVTMLKLLRDHTEELCLSAAPEQFDEVIEKTLDMLQNRSLNLEIQLIDRTVDTAFFAVTIQNKAGHKFPSGYPSRRAFIDFSVVDEFGDTLFFSGKTDSEYEVFGHNADYEPHYEMINSEDQIQIYELVLGDVNDDVTTVLERADAPLKDNRIPPVGFTTSHEVYDTTIIAGNALFDENFNMENDFEGSGSDIIYYHIPLNGNLENLLAYAKIYYQSTPPKWMKEMFEENSPEIDSFRNMFAKTDRSPVLMQSENIMIDGISTSFEPKTDAFVKVFPSLSNDGFFNVQSDQKHDFFVFDNKGKLIKSESNKEGTYSIQLENLKGIFFLKFIEKKGLTFSQKVIIQ
jgi:hypothetical protein